MSCCRDIKTLIIRDPNGSNKRKNVNIKQMPKYIQKRKNQFLNIYPISPNILLTAKTTYTKCESHKRLLEKIVFSPKKYIHWVTKKEQEQIYIILKQKNSHTLDYANTNSRQRNNQFMYNSIFI